MQPTPLKPGSLSLAPMIWLQTCVMGQATATHQFQETSHTDKQDWYQWYKEAQEKIVRAQQDQYKNERDMAACPEETQHLQNSSHISLWAVILLMSARRHSNNSSNHNNKSKTSETTDAE